MDKVKCNRPDTLAGGRGKEMRGLRNSPRRSPLTPSERPIAGDGPTSVPGAAQPAILTLGLAGYGARASLLAGLGLLEASAFAPVLETFDVAERFRAVRDRGAAPWSGVSEALDGMAPR